MNYLYNQKVACFFSLLVIVPILYLVGADKFPEQYKKYLVYLAIFVGIISLLKLAKLTGMTQKIKVLNMVEGMEGTTECSTVHHVKVFDSNPGLSQPILKINKGECVIWTNIGEIQHTVTATDDYRHPNNVFASGILRTGQFFGVKFMEPGEYKYFCMNHKGGNEMGVVIVE